MNVSIVRGRNNLRDATWTWTIGLMIDDHPLVRVLQLGINNNYLLIRQHPHSHLSFLPHYYSGEWSSESRNRFMMSPSAVYHYGQKAPSTFKVETRKVVDLALFGQTKTIAPPGEEQPRRGNDLIMVALTLSNTIRKYLRDGARTNSIQAFLKLSGTSQKTLFLI
jgi:hypothetical protein